MLKSIRTISACITENVKSIIHAITFHFKRKSGNQKTIVKARSKTRVGYKFTSNPTALPSGPTKKFERILLVADVWFDQPLTNGSLSTLEFRLRN
jgi:hypothetical protein